MLRTYSRALQMAAAILITSFLAPPSLRAATPELVEAARREGRVSWYTTLLIEQFARPLATAFEKKYGVKVDIYRGEPATLAARIGNEGRAGKMQSDVFDGINTAPALKRQGFVERWMPDGSRRFAAHYNDPDGYWAGTHFYVLTPGFNKDLVPPGTEPKTFQDLLDPKWKSKMVWNTSPTSTAAAGFIGLVLAHMGEAEGIAYLRQLAKQDITGVRTGVRLVYNKVISGEFPIALQIINTHAVVTSAAGAPGGWIAMQPASAVLSGISLTKGALNPNAAKLLIEFIVSEEGQTFIRDAEYIPVDANVKLKHPELRPDDVKFRAIYFTQEDVDSGIPKWMKIFEDIFK